MPVYSALQNLAQNIRGGLGDIGRARLAGAELGLQRSERELTRELALGREARAGEELGLRKEAAGRAEEEHGIRMGMLQQQAERETAKAEYMQQPWTFAGDIAPGVDSSRKFTSLVNTVPLIEEVTGTKMDEQGRFMRGNVPVTREEASLMREPIMGAIMGGVTIDAEKPLEGLQKQQDLLVRAKATMGLTGPTPAFDTRIEILQDRIDQEQAKEIAEIKRPAARDVRTGTQKEFDRFKQTPLGKQFKGSIIDFAKAWRKKDKYQVALELASRDRRLSEFGEMTVQDIAQEYMDAMTALSKEAPAAEMRKEGESIADYLLRIK